MTFTVTQMTILLIVGIALGMIAGIRIGKGKAESPVPAGFIDFVKLEDGHEQCVFKLKDDVDWIAKQDFIIFQVRRGPDDASP